jgi:hypothetical protein
MASARYPRQRAGTKSSAAASGTLRALLPVQLLEDLHRVEQRRGSRTAGEVDRLQYRRGELPQVGVRLGHQRHVPVVARQPRLGRGQSAAQPTRPQTAQDRPDLLVRDAHVGDDRQDLVQQRQAFLADLARSASVLVS